MSDPQAKAERSKAKDNRQTPASDDQKPQRSKKDKPIVVECKRLTPLPPSLLFLGNDWVFYGRYRDIKTANEVIAREKRKNPDRYEMRIRG